MLSFKCVDYEFEGNDIQYTLEEIEHLQISNDPIINIEITESGKIIALTQKKISKITIYKEQTYEIEKSILLGSIVNSLKIYENKIFCALSELSDNILIISLDNFDDKLYLSGHSSFVTDLTCTSQGYLVSADKEGNIKIWENYKITKSINDFNKKINTITEICEKRQRLAILSFSEEKVKFYDLRYNNLIPLATISDIMGSGFQNNMLKFNPNILAIAGTYMYIIDINSFIITNKIHCMYANDSISLSLNIIDNKGYFFVGQAKTNKWNDDLEKGTIGYYEYDFNNLIIPDDNYLIKKASKNGCHKSFITSIRTINNIIVTGAYDGKIKFWKLNDI